MHETVAGWLVALGLAGAVWGQEATLERPESVVVILGEELGAVLDVRREQMGLFAWRGGSLEPIPFQIDERTPDGDFAYPLGDERRTDTDDGLLDANDELVFRAGDVGGRAPVGVVHQTNAGFVEIEVWDPAREGARGWVYLAAFAEGTPERAGDDRVALRWNEVGDLTGWETARLRVGGGPEGLNFLHLYELRFAEEGEVGPDVLDRAKIKLEVSYLFTDITRAFDEVRTGVRSYLDGPVRAVVRFSLETYLIWGHWIRTSPGPGCRALIYEDRLELELRLRVPVDLERDQPSALRLSWDFAEAAGEVRVWSDRNPERWRAGSRRRSHLRAFERTYPRWVCVGLETGSALARLLPGENMEDVRYSLYLEEDDQPDPPEDDPGSRANTGFSLDLTGVRAGDYVCRLEWQFGEALEPGEERELLRAFEPLRVTVRPVE